MTRFPPYVEEKLRAIGWFPGRDVSADFKFPPESRLFPASIAAYREFGYLRIPGKFLETLRPEEGESIAFDIDNSVHSISYYCDSLLNTLRGNVGAPHSSCSCNHLCFSYDR